MTRLSSYCVISGRLIGRIREGILRVDSKDGHITPGDVASCPSNSSSITDSKIRAIYPCPFGYHYHYRGNRAFCSDIYKNLR